MLCKGQCRRYAKCAGTDDRTIHCIKGDGFDRAEFCDVDCLLVCKLAFADDFLCLLRVCDARNFAALNALCHQFHGFFVLVSGHFQLHRGTICIDIAILAVLKCRLYRRSCIVAILGLDVDTVYHAVGAIFGVIAAHDLCILTGQDIIEVVRLLCSISMSLCCLKLVHLGLLRRRIHICVNCAALDRCRVFFFLFGLNIRKELCFLHCKILPFHFIGMLHIICKRPFSFVLIIARVLDRSCPSSFFLENPVSIFQNPRLNFDTYCQKYTTYIIIGQASS